MCNIEAGADAVRQVKAFLDGDKFNDRQLAEVYAIVREVMSDLEKGMDGIKAELIRREIEPVELKERKEKVLIAEGRSSSEYNTEGAFNNCPDEWKKRFWEVVQPVVSRIGKNESTLSALFIAEKQMSRNT